MTLQEFKDKLLAEYPEYKNTEHFDTMLHQAIKEIAKELGITDKEQE